MKIDVRYKGHRVWANPLALRPLQRLPNLERPRPNHLCRVHSASRSQHQAELLIRVPVSQCFGTGNNQALGRLPWGKTIELITSGRHERTDGNGRRACPRPNPLDQCVRRPCHWNMRAGPLAPHSPYLNEPIRGRQLDASLSRKHRTARRRSFQLNKPANHPFSPGHHH